MLVEFVGVEDLLFIGRIGQGLELVLKFAEQSSSAVCT